MPTPFIATYDFQAKNGHHTWSKCNTSLDVDIELVRRRHVANNLTIGGAETKRDTTY